MNNLIAHAKILILTLIVFAALGCQTKKEVVFHEQANPAKARVSCQAPDTYLIEEAFAESRQTLSNPTCYPQYEIHFQALLQIAQNDPKPSNKDLFYDYFIWAKDQGIISTMMARNYWRSYFTTHFTSLPDEYAVCHHCSSKQEIFKHMQNELSQKRLGFMAIRDPRGTQSSHAGSDSYNQALRNYESIVLMFTAACQACLIN